MERTRVQHKIDYFGKLWDWVFPRTCFSCQKVGQDNLFCKDCLEHLDLLRSEGRCIKCFEEISLRRGICIKCRSVSHPFKELAACFEHTGPAEILLHALENRSQFLCAKDIAALFVLQIHALKWPMFDCIVPLPQHFSQTTQMIVKALSRFLQCPIKKILRKKWEVLPQFVLKKKCNIYTQRVLLVATSINTRNSIRNAASVLEDGCPLEIYGMAFCVK